VLEESIAASICFGVYEGSEQVGFARVVTDGATFAWLCDLFVVESRQGQGLGKWLVESVVTHPQLRDLKLFLLATRDAQELYRKYGGFENLEEPERWMAKTRKNT
jgi:GNAT superfamily N-acetyltransferase